MNKPHNKSTSEQLKFRQPDRKSLIQGGIVVFIIACTPFIYYAYESFPADSAVWETSFFTFTTKYPNLNQYAWFLSNSCDFIAYMVFHMQTLVALDYIGSAFNVYFSAFQYFETKFKCR